MRSESGSSVIFTTARSSGSWDCRCRCASRLQLATGAAPDAVARLDRAESELREAIVELRELAHGIFPSGARRRGAGSGRRSAR